MPDRPLDPAPPAGDPRTSLDGAFSALRGLGVRRRSDDRWLAGVCSGVADRLGIDPIIVRGVVLALVFIGGLGGLLYLVGWALLPDQRGRIVAEEAAHGHGWSIVLLVVVGLSVVGTLLDRWWLWFVLVPVAVLAWWAVTSARAGRTPEQMGQQLRSLGDRVTSALAAPRVESDGVPATTAYAAPPASASPPAPPPANAAPPAPPPAYAAPSPTPVAPSAGPHPLGPGRSGPIAAPPRVVHQNRRRGGLLALLLTAGLAVAGYGLGSMLATDRGWAGSPELVGGAFAVAGAALALVVVGLAGRRAGLSALLVTTMTAVLVLATTLPTPPSGGFGDRSWVAGAAPVGGFSLTAGDATLDLTGAAAGSRTTVVLGAGQLTVRVPAGMTATVDAAIRAGQMDVRSPTGVTVVQAGVGPERMPQRVGSGPTAVSVDVTIALGQLTIVEVAP